MPKFFKDILEDGNRVGKIVSDEPVGTGETKAGNTWNDWDVTLDDGFKTVLRTFGDKGNGHARSSVGADQEFFLNNGFINFKDASGSYKKTAVPDAKEYPKQVKSDRVDQSVWDRKDREASRSMALSYAKDLAVAGKIEVDGISDLGEKFANFITAIPMTNETPVEELDVPF